MTNMQNPKLYTVFTQYSIIFRVYSFSSSNFIWGWRSITQYSRNKV